MTVALTSRLIVRVVQTGGAVQQLIGRSAAMVLWLAIYSDQINDTFRGTVTFDWEGPSLRPNLHKKFDRINTDTLMPLSDASST